MRLCMGLRYYTFYCSRGENIFSDDFSIFLISGRGLCSTEVVEFESLTIIAFADGPSCFSLICITVKALFVCFYFSLALSIHGKIQFNFSSGSSVFDKDDELLSDLSTLLLFFAFKSNYFSYSQRSYAAFLID